MLSPDARRRFLEIGIFVMPIVLVQLSSVFLGGGGPEEAEAAEDVGETAPPEISVRAPIVWEDAERAAGARVLELVDQPITGSPMYYERRAETPVDPGDSRPRYNPLQVTLSGIMKSSSGAVALIDESALRIGDTVGGGAWEIISIDAHERAVTFAHTETKETVVLVVPRSGE